MLTKKAQFGPDFIIAMVLVLILGLGGVLFLQLFVGGLSMQGLLSIIDTENDQKCYGILLAMVGDEYATGGENLRGGTVFDRPYFSELNSYYSTINAEGAVKSIRFEQRMQQFNDSLSLINLRPGRIDSMYYFLASRSNARIARDKILDDIQARGHQPNQYTVCAIPIFGPYEPGIAELYLRII